MNINSKYLYYYIYLTKNIVTGKKYIGWHATNKLYDGYIGSGHLFKKSVKKYGKECFINGIIEFCSDNNFLEREKYWINQIGTLVPNGYNLTIGGEGAIGYKHTPENIELFKNRKYSQESKLKMSESRKKRKCEYSIIHSQETKDKISKTLKDKNVDKTEDIKRLYVEGKKYKDIQNELKCSFKTISKTLKENDIKGRNWSDYNDHKLSESTKNKLSMINLQKSEEKWNDIKNLYINGSTTKDICKSLHCSPNTITKVIKKFNLMKNGQFIKI